MHAHHSCRRIRGRLGFQISPATTFLLTSLHAGPLRGNSELAPAFKVNNLPVAKTTLGLSGRLGKYFLDVSSLTVLELNACSKLLGHLINIPENLSWNPPSHTEVAHVAAINAMYTVLRPEAVIEYDTTHPDVYNFEDIKARKLTIRC
jgi:hypothetical protein